MDISSLIYILKSNINVTVTLPKVPIYNLWSLRNIGGVFTWIFKKYMSEKAIGSVGGNINIPSLPSEPFAEECSTNEFEEFLKFIAERLDTSLINLFEQYLLSKIGKPWLIKRWIKVGCLILNIEFDDDELVEEVINCIKEGTKTSKVSFKIKSWVSRFSGFICPVDKKQCDKYRLEDIINCEKFRESLLLQIRDAIGDATGK